MKRSTLNPWKSQVLLSKLFIDEALESMANERAEKIRAELKNRGIKESSIEEQVTRVREVVFEEYKNLPKDERAALNAELVKKALIKNAETMYSGSQQSNIEAEGTNSQGMTAEGQNDAAQAKKGKKKGSFRNWAVKTAVKVLPVRQALGSYLGFKKLVSGAIDKTLIGGVAAYTLVRKGLSKKATATSKAQQKAAEQRTAEQKENRSSEEQQPAKTTDLPPCEPGYSCESSENSGSQDPKLPGTA